MKIKGSRCLFKLGTHNRTFISGHELDINHNGKDRKYWMVSRGEEITKPHEKKPDAVVIVAIHHNGDERTLVVTNEFRPAIGMREIGFPAGLIDAADYEKANGNPIEAAILAAKRELFEETGLTLSNENLEYSPANCYSSAGLTNESVCYVIGKATGKPTMENAESYEDIETILMPLSEIRTMIETPLPHEAYSKAAWPFMWAFAKWGFPK